jgi:hypothetical protein
MESLGRYPLSVILSFLSETEGTSLLITKKRYALFLLPLFRVRSDEFDGLKVNGSKKRHRFVVCPAQDPIVLLNRLNTRKLFKRKTIPIKHRMTTSQMAAEEWKQQPRNFPAQLQCLRFLDKTITKQFTDMIGTLLVSYPRSGNTLMRTLLEKATGIVTGSDTRPDRSLSLELAERHNLVGEGVTHPSMVAFVKTHWPERTGNQVYKGKRAILLVRNPYDAIDSYWNLNVTKSHTKTVTDSVYERFHDKFERLARNEICIWLQFQDYWLRKANIPVLLIRFEDLIRNPAEQLARAIMFASGANEIPLFWKERIDYVVNGCQSIEGMGSYKPRSSTGSGFGKSLLKGRYTKDTIDYMHNAAQQISCTDYLSCLGYSVKEHNFPSEDLLDRFRQKSFDNLPSERDDYLMVNQGVPIRPDTCEFGRQMTPWRHSITDNDANPLPTI